MMGMPAASAFAAVRAAPPVASRNFLRFICVLNSSCLQASLTTLLEEGPFSVLESLPRPCGAAFRIPDHLAFAQSQLAMDTFRAGPAGSAGIHESEMTFFNAQNRDIRFRTDVQVS